MLNRKSNFKTSVAQNIPWVVPYLGSSGRISKYIDGLMHSVFSDSLNSSQDKDSDAQTLTIHYFFAEICPVLIDCWRVHAILLLCRGIRCLITLLSYSQQKYIVVVYSTLMHCWAIPNPNILLK